MEARILAVETHIDPFGLQSTPKPADSWQKIKGSNKKTKNKTGIPQLFSSLHVPSTINHQYYTSLLHSFVLLPASSSYSPFPLSPSLPDNTSHRSSHQMWLSTVFAPLFSIFFSSLDPIFWFPSYYYFLPIYRSPSPLYICSFLVPSAHLLLCVHKRRRSNTLTCTHPFLSLLPPAVYSPYWRLSHRGLATDLIRVSVVAKVESVALRFTAGT